MQIESEMFIWLGQILYIQTHTTHKFGKCVTGSFFFLFSRSHTLSLCLYFTHSFSLYLPVQLTFSLIKSEISILMVDWILSVVYMQFKKQWHDSLRTHLNEFKSKIESEVASAGIDMSPFCICCHKYVRNCLSLNSVFGYRAYWG